LASLIIYVGLKRPGQNKNFIGVIIHHLHKIYIVFHDEEAKPQAMKCLYKLQGWLPHMKDLSTSFIYLFKPMGGDIPKMQGETQLSPHPRPCTMTTKHAIVTLT
jgi:hypothetical protein